jgi:hypothetical protein
MLVARSLKAMANNTIPKTMRIILMPCLPKIFSSFEEDFRRI